MAYYYYFVFSLIFGKLVAHLVAHVGLVELFNLWVHSK